MHTRCKCLAAGHYGNFCLVLSDPPRGFIDQLRRLVSAMVADKLVGGVDAELSREEAGKVLVRPRPSCDNVNAVY